MTASSSLFLGVAGVFCWFIGLAVLVAFVVVIATVVRRHRPDTLPILLGVWGVIRLALPARAMS